MFGRSKSAQKFRSVQASRTREAKVTDDNNSAAPKPFLSVKKPNRNKYTNILSSPQNQSNQNPQLIQQPNKYDQNISKKLDIGNYPTILKISGMNYKEPIKNIKEKQKQQKKQNYNGRNLQYPQTKNANYRPQTAPNKDQLKKYSSQQKFSSQHFVDRSSKSRSIIAQKQQFNEKFKKAFNYLIENNAAYLQERRRTCNQKARPKQQILKINLAKTPSTYVQHYPPKQPQHQLYMEPQNQKTALGLGPRKVCGNSTNNEIHNGKQGPRADLATWPQGFKLQGPLDSTTTYANHFPHHGDFESMVPVLQFKQIVRGMPFKKNTTNRDHFKGQFTNKSDIAKWNNLHPYGNSFNPNRSTHYKSTHNYKDKQPIQQWPMYDPRLIVTNGKFTTENRDKINVQHTHELNEENYCKCDRCLKKLKH